MCDLRQSEEFNNPNRKLIGYIRENPVTYTKEFYPTSFGGFIHGAIPMEDDSCITYWIVATGCGPVTVQNKSIVHELHHYIFVNDF